jgi:hypothetical protein
MAKRDDVFPSKYLKASDLNGKPCVVTITSAPLETLKTPDGKEDTKTVLYFRSAKKTLPLNRTNWDAVADIAGDDTDAWPGCQVELYPTKTEMRGDVVACIRIRAPSQGQLKTPAKKPPPADDMGDVLPW